MQMIGQEKDSCGVGFVAHVGGQASHQVVALALEALGNHAHRGAVAADGKTGDGAGLMTQTPRKFFQKVYRTLHGRSVPAEQWAVGSIYLPLGDARGRSQARRCLEESLRYHQLEPLGWREVPLDLEALGQRALSIRPHMQHLFVGQGQAADFESALYRARRRAERILREGKVHEDFYIASLSSHSITYKGLCGAAELGRFFPDLTDPDFESAVALFHQRYSTNTFPSWNLTQPFRMICHNGEINTLQANQKWMRAREVALEKAGKGPSDLTPVIQPGTSDSGAFDNVLEFFVRGGRETLPSLMMMVPELWENVPSGGMPESWRDFYRYLGALLEPWEGPAAMAFFDGRWVGALLDRNGLRPMRYTILKNQLVVASSEAGCVKLDEHLVEKRGMLGPGEIIAIDLNERRWVSNHELKEQLAQRHPYGQLMAQREVSLPDQEVQDSWLETPSKETLHRRQLAFGFNHEDEIAVLKPMMASGSEPIGSMGDDTPPAAISPTIRPLFHYFRQRFAQVTNPPIDPLREKLVMSLRTWVGRRANVLTEEMEVCRLVDLPGPVLSTSEFRRLMSLSPRWLPHIVLHCVWSPQSGPRALEERLELLCNEAEEAVRQGASMVVLYDGGVNAFRAPIPSLLATSAVHHRLMEAGLRLNATLIVVSGEPREVHHFACLLGYGAGAIFPYLALDTIAALAPERAAEAQTKFIAAIHTGLLKIMAKMGISVLSSYRAGQVFESLGLDQRLVERYFPDTPAWLGGLSLDQLALRQASWHQQAFAQAEPTSAHAGPGFYKFKKDGERHRFSPLVIKALHQILEKVALTPVENPYQKYRGGLDGYDDYVQTLRDQGRVGLRDLLDFVRHRPRRELSEVEPLEAIVARFSTGAMSHGSLSSEAHETLSVALNRLGAASNCGEGGEAPERYGTTSNSRIKQVASGRFGVTPAYLLSADELQIKMAQGSKPGEGGQIPGHKVTDEIARVRHTRSGVDLISPPPHHDIYSIEDLAQLIHDLKRLHPGAKVSVKLVSEDGVGTVAAGVAKGHADIIQISGSEGGTGASPLSSIKFAGMPWELGLAQAQQTLVANGLRAKIRLRVDGGFQSGRDVLLAALLGADEYAFGTSVLVAEGCLMARACHNNTCPVGIASQDPKLRAKFPGTPEKVIAYLLGVAEEVRHLLAQLGATSLQEVIGRTELLEQVVLGEQAGFLDLTPLLARADDDLPLRHEPGLTAQPPRHGRDLDQQIIEQLDNLPAEFEILNTDRAFGARLSGYLIEKHGRKGHDCALPAGSLKIKLRGSAGQSLGAFGVSALHLDLTGQANDYVGKGLHGGQIVIRPSFPELGGQQNWIAGNTLLYGATGGVLLASGRVGQRLAVRNSGATAVVEGAGEHACEYMTGGLVIILGSVGRNLGAAMTGGRAFIYDQDDDLQRKLNHDSVQAVPLLETSQQEQAELKHWVEEHERLTGSLLARE
ncbi:MAG: glutamate synthase large subunit, partial [Vulcanimicrobiota bacterium]